MNVQLRNALRKFDRAQIEIEMLKENRQIQTVPTEPSTTSAAKIHKIKSDPKLVKKYFNIEEILNDPVKTKQYVDKLNLQLIEKDSIIRDLNEQINNKYIQNAKQTNESNELPSTTIPLAFEQ